MGCEMGKIKVVMNKPVYLGQAILDLTKIVMYEFHYLYETQVWWDPKLCYMDTDSHFYADENDVELRFDMSGYDKKMPDHCP